MVYYFGLYNKSCGKISQAIFCDCRALPPFRNYLAVDFVTSNISIDILKINKKRLIQWIEAADNNKIILKC